MNTSRHLPPHYVGKLRDRDSLLSALPPVTGVNKTTRYAESECAADPETVTGDKPPHTPPTGRSPFDLTLSFFQLAV